MWGRRGPAEPEGNTMGINWTGLKGKADNGDVWTIKSRPQGGFNLLRNGLVLATSFNVTEAKIIADDIDAG